MVPRYDLMCHVHGLSYDFDARAGQLINAADECCDMRACVRLFEGIDPRVLRIDTFAGEKRDTVYMRPRKNGKWEAYCPVEKKVSH